MAAKLEPPPPRDSDRFDNWLIRLYQRVQDLEGGTESTSGQLSATQLADLTDGGASALHFHAADRARQNHTGTQLAATISDLAAFVASVTGNSDHAGLSNLGWTSSGHTGAATTLAGFSGAGAPTTYAIPLTVANGGTGRVTGATAYGLLAAGTTATGVHQTLPAGLTTQILVGGGASALPAWTTATGTGAPVRQTAAAVGGVWTASSAWTLPAFTLGGTVTLNGQTFSGAAAFNAAVTGITDLTTTGNTILGNASADTLNVGNGDIIKDASGNVGIGTTPTAVPGTGNPVVGAHNLIIYNAGNLGLTLFSDTPTGHTRTQQIGFGSEGISLFDAGLKYDNLNRILEFWAGSAAQGGFTNDGRLYGKNLHNVGAVTGTTNQYIASGTYTPTLTNGTNVAASTADVCNWIRVGNVVHVVGRIQADATSGGGTPTTLSISLPIASNFANVRDCAGVMTIGTVPTTVFTTGGIFADATNDRAQVDWNSQTTINENLYFTFTYLVL